MNYREKKYHILEHEPPLFLRYDVLTCSKEMELKRKIGMEVTAVGSFYCKNRQYDLLSRQGAVLKRGICPRCVNCWKKPSVGERDDEKPDISKGDTRDPEKQVPATEQVEMEGGKVVQCDAVKQ